MLSGIPQNLCAMICRNYSYFLITTLSLFWISSSLGSDTNSHLFPPGSLGLNQVSEFNVTGPLNSFVEQIQANSRSQEINQGQPIPQQPQVSNIQTPASAGVVYSQAQIPQIPLQQPQPVILGPQNRPSIDPALQQLLNSFNTIPAEAQRNTFIQAGPAAPDLNTPVVSYITCYVGCSHVTNIVTNSALKTVKINPSFSIIFLMISLGMLLF